MNKNEQKQKQRTISTNSSSKRVVIVVDGGLVSCVYSQDPEAEVLVVDFDNDEGEGPSVSDEWIVPIEKISSRVKEAIERYEQQ